MQTHYLIFKLDASILCSKCFSYNARFIAWIYRTLRTRFPKDLYILCQNGNPYCCNWVRS